MYWIQLEKGNGWKSRYEGLTDKEAKGLFSLFIEMFGIENVTSGKMP